MTKWSIGRLRGEGSGLRLECACAASARIVEAGSAALAAIPAPRAVRSRNSLRERSLSMDEREPTSPRKSRVAEPLRKARTDARGACLLARSVVAVQRPRLHGPVDPRDE